MGLVTILVLGARVLGIGMGFVLIWNVGVLLYFFFVKVGKPMGHDVIFQIWINKGYTRDGNPLNIRSVSWSTF